jgi:pimeloyl-ACP methyl ester carboxylesterase
VVVVIPGALTSVRAYDGYPLPPGAAKVGYRFPGVDGRPRDRALKIAEAGAEIAAWVNARPLARVRLIGMSTGAAVALEAAKRIEDGPRVEVALLSSALPAPGTAFHSALAFTDIAAAAHRADSWDRLDLWPEYYRTLLLGRHHYRIPPLAAYSAEVAGIVRDNLRLPGDGITRAHGANLLTWRLTDRDALSRARILFLHGAEDPVFPAPAIRRLAASLPQARLILYPLSGHLLLATEPSVYADMEAVFAGWN